MIHFKRPQAAPGMAPVSSGAIEAIGYDPAAQSLTVKFKSGGTHRYDGVTPDKHAALMAAPSKGAHFHAHIRGGHVATKVEG